MICGVQCRLSPQFHTRLSIVLWSEIEKAKAIIKQYFEQKNKYYSHGK